ncbi:MAG: ribosome biogenesis factor YjgA [Comamonadaceae bacterium]|nr:ribosome biogenesis factor YjgA [Comamonadaceae bacterium]
MSRKSRKGYFVRGQFVAEGSELDQELKRELKGDAPSKTELKAQSAELQALGEALLTLRPALREPLALPARLLDALEELARITDFEGKRRQSQYVGKLMRQLDEEEVAAIRAALEVQRQCAAQDTLLLHAAEDWRARLVADDAAAHEWMNQFPGTDAQQLRALIRQARKDMPPASRDAQSKGQAPRQSRAWRELFQLLRAALADAAPAP